MRAVDVEYATGIEVPKSVQQRLVHLQDFELPEIQSTVEELSDYPYMPEHLIEQSAQEVTDGFDAFDRKSIERDNALKLFPRLQAS